MKLVSPLPHKRGRLEIIPLIDIMFFLLAAFMVVSIGKIHLKSLKVSLPTDVPAAQKEPREDFIDLSISADGLVQLDKEPIPTKEVLLTRLQEIYLKNKDQKFLITADKDSRHGDVMSVLGRLRAAGFQKVAFSIKGERSPASSGGSSPVEAPSVGASPASAAAPAASGSASVAPLDAAVPSTPAPIVPVTEAVAPPPTTSTPAAAAPASSPSPAGN